MQLRKWTTSSTLKSSYKGKSEGHPATGQGGPRGPG